MKHVDERGVTLLELLLAVAILVTVTSAVIAFINSAYDSYSITSKRSLNQQQATTLINRLAEDIRAAELIKVEKQDGSDQVTITKRPDPTAAPYSVHYAKQEDGSIVYVNESTHVLADSGKLSVDLQDGAYQLSITVGEGADSISLHTSVARYDWGR